MAKKSSPVAYKPLDTTNIVYDNKFIETKVADIPPYEDSGIRFQGKYKEQTGNYSYELHNQIPYSYSFELGIDMAGKVAGNYTFGFLMTRIVINYISISYVSQNPITELTFSDSNNVNLFKLNLPPTYTGADIRGQNFSLNIIPKLTTTEEFNINLGQDLNAGDWVTVTFYGWTENF